MIPIGHPSRRWCIAFVVSETKDEIVLRAVELALEQAESVTEPCDVRRAKDPPGGVVASWISAAMLQGHTSSLRRSRS